MTRHDPGRTSHNPHADDPRGPVAVQWSVQRPAFESSEPIVAGNSVYCNSQSGLEALNAEDGSTQQEFGSFERGANPPVVEGETVFATENNTGLAAFDRSTGTERWFQHRYLKLTEPTLADGILYVPSYGGILAFDPSQEKELWWNVTGDFSYPDPAIHDGTLYARNGGQLSAFDTESGAERWTTSARSKFITPPTFADGQLFIGGGDSQIYCIDPVSESVEWQQNGVHANAPLATDGDSLLVATEDESLVSIDTDDGTINWRQPALLAHNAPSIGSETVFHSSEDGGVTAFDLESGEQLWNLDLPLQIASTPVVASDTVYVQSKGTYYAIGDE